MRRDGGGGAKGTAARCANQDVYPTSALCALVEAGDVQALNKAIQEDEGATTAPSGPWRRSLLHVASETGQAQCAQLLLSKGARVAAVDSEGTAALHLAAARGHDPVVHLLLLHNADVFAVDGWGSSPLALAAANGNAPVVRRLLFRIQQLQLPPRPAPPSSLLQTTEVVSPASLGGLSPPGEEEEEDAGGSGAIDSVNNFGRTPLWRAACGGHVDACRLLLQAGAGLAVKDDHGTTPRDIAMDRGHDAVVALIDKWKPAIPSHRNGGTGLLGLPTVSPYSAASSDDRHEQQQQQQQQQPPASAMMHVVVPSPALT